MPTCIYGADTSQNGSTANSLMTLPLGPDGLCPAPPTAYQLGGVQTALNSSHLVGVSLDASEYQQFLLQSSQITTLNAQVSALVAQNDYLPHIATSGSLEVVAALFFAAFTGFKTGFVA